MAGIIWLASYPKSGNTWTRAFIHNFFENSKEPVDINKLGRFSVGEGALRWHRAVHKKIELTPADNPEIARLRSKVHEAMARSHKDSVFAKTHNYLGEAYGYPMHNMNVTSGTIYILRNPLDVAISMTSHYELSQDEAIARLGDPLAFTDTGDKQVYEKTADWSTHVMSWTQNPNPYLHVMRYEDLKANPKKYFGRMIKFLGVQCPQERISRAIRHSSFKTLKDQEKEKGFREKSDKAQTFFRKGKKDQWREVLTKEQIETIVSNHRRVMEKYNYIPDGY